MYPNIDGSNTTESWTELEACLKEVWVALPDVLFMS